MQKYRTIVADPPLKQRIPQDNKYWKKHRFAVNELPYPTMSLDEIKSMPVSDYAEVGCHLWLWTTNEFLRAGFDVMEAWGFKYLAPVHWKKPSGVGNYFVHVTQTLLFGYYGKCKFEQERYLPNFFEASAGRHSQKPEKSYDFIERISSPARLEMFSRRARLGWHVFGNEVESDVEIPVRHLTPLALDTATPSDNEAALRK